MNLREVKRHFHVTRNSPNSGLISNFTFEVKVKSKGGMYYTAVIDNVKLELERARKELPTEPLYSGELLEERVKKEARCGVQYVLEKLGTCDGWWFEDETIWLSKSEIGIIFADITLLYSDGSRAC